MKKIITIAALLSTTTLVGCGFTTVDTGERGVKTNFGKVVEVLDEGFHTYNPFTETVTTLDTRVQRRDGEAFAYTRDVQQVKVSFAVTYSLNPANVAAAFQQAGTNWESKFVEPVVQAAVKELVGQYEAVDLVAQRGQAQAKVAAHLSEVLAKNGVTLSDFNMTNLDFNDDFEAAVESKVRAVQDAERAKNETVRIQEEAAQKVISAKAEAEAMRIQSQALSENKGLTDYKAVEKWNGVLPTMMTGNSVPFINIH